MLIPKTFRQLSLATFSVCSLLLLTSPARAQFKIEYIIAWGKRETMEHRGNLTEYFAKTTLTVK
jgi:hypothetical protein